MGFEASRSVAADSAGLKPKPFDDGLGEFMAQL